MSRVLASLRAVVAGAALFLPALAWADGAWLGLILQPGPQGGAQIVDVYPDSPLAPLLQGQKFSLGETVVGFDGKPVSKPKDLSARVRQLKVGQTVTLKLVRPGGQAHEVQATLTARPSEQQLEQQAMHLEEQRQKRMIGQPAPEFVVDLQHGPKLPAPALAGTLAALRGQPIVLVFFASWCGPCLREIPQLTAMQALRPDVRVLALSTEEPDKIREVIERFSPGYSVGRDLERRAYIAYGVASYPTTFLIDGAGIVRAVDHGSLETVQQQLDKIPPPPRKPSTK